jgi:hypothetical protein
MTHRTRTDWTEADELRRRARRWRHLRRHRHRAPLARAYDIEWLEEYQRDLEQAAADVAARIKRLKEGYPETL